ncbi:MAG: carbohydrate kinase family protein, partial [Candidatus Magasanikbacteria bacterium]|nr:carbohydrate kinase family protein [Candidatus Magasanikbacteria bacterium]
FKKEKVSTKYIMVDKKNRTDYSSILSFKGERTLLTFQVPRKYSLPTGIKTEWIFLGALPDGHKLLHSQIVKKVKKEKVKIGYNPGAHELRDGIDGMKDILKVTEVFIVNKEEAWRLIGKDEDIKILLTKLKKYGPKLVVITDGKNGACCFDGDNFYHQPIFNLPVVEKTGAGDAFATGFVSALIHDLDVKTALRYGAANSASVVGHIGAQAGLMTKLQMKKFLDQHKETRARII